jgi:hypothetical protein
MPVRAVPLFLIVAASHLLLAARSAPADDAPRPTPRLALACAANNDVYCALGGAKAGVARFDTAGHAVEAAPAGGGVLIMADGYPATFTPIPADVLDRAAAKKLRLYVEYPESFPGVEFGATRSAKWERGVVAASGGLGEALPLMRILALHEAQFRPATAKDPLLVLARVAGFDKAVYGLPEEQFPVLFEAQPGVFVATTKLSDFVRSRYAPAAAWVDVWQAVLRKLDPAGAPHKLVAEPTIRPAYAKEAVLPEDAERVASARFAGWILNSHLLNPAERNEEFRKLQASGHTLIDPPAKDASAGDGSLGIGEGYMANILPGGGQKRQIAVRADCQAESAAVLAIDATLGNNPDRGAAVAKSPSVGTRISVMMTIL